MSQYSPRPAPHPRPVHPPFTRIACLVDSDAGTEAAVTQAIALAGDDAAVRFVALSHAHGPLEQAVERARDAGCTAEPELLERATFHDALGRVNVLHDLVVVGAHEHARATGIVLGEAATQLVHRSPLPVLIARTRPLADGVLAASRAHPNDRAALTAATRLAARLGAELTVVHVRMRGDAARRPELQAELANARALLGRPLDLYEPSGPVARTLVDAAEGDGCGLLVLGSRARTGLLALGSVSERVAHLAPCSVLVMRGR
jgi:nucleotide-binding universal stress UspA family protein